MKHLVKLSLSAFILTVNISVATNYYVNDGSQANDIYCTVVGNNGNTGLSPSSPKAGLTNLFTTYNASFTTGDTIFVDAGTYTDRDLSSPPNGVVIKGAGIIYTAFNLTGSNHFFMLINDNNTVLSDMKVHGFDNQTISGVQSVGVAANTTGVQLTNVMVDGSATTSTGGGYPIEIASGASVLLNGGGLTCNSWDAGGGIQISGASANVTIRNYQFIGNYQLWNNGTALKINNGTVNVYNSRFEYNTIGGDKSGICIEMAAGTVNVYDSYFSANETNILSNAIGGAISIKGGVFRITRSRIINNVPEPATSGIYGAGIGVNGGTVTIDSCQFSGNTGARANDVYVRNGSVSAHNCTFGSAANQIGIAGGTFSIADCGSPSEYGSGIVHVNTNLPSYTASPELPYYLPVTCASLPCTTPAISSASAPATVCSGNSFATAFAANTSAGQTSYAWSSTIVAGITGHATSGTGNIHETLVNTTATPIDVVYTVIPTFNLTCNGAAVNYTVTVQPAVTMTSSNTTSICSGTALNFNLSSNVNATYSWIATDNANTSGETTTSQSSSIISDMIQNNTTVAQTVSYSIIPTSTNGNCVGSTQTLSVTINPTPIVNNLVNPASGCAEQTISAYPFSTSPSGATTTWSNNNTATGLSASGSNSPVPGFTAANVGAQETSIITITPTLGSCAGPALSYTITINPNPTIVVSATVADPGSCGGNDGSISGIVITGAPTITYSWNSGMYTSADITGLTAGNYNLIATDGNGCTADTTYSLTDPAAPAAPVFTISNNTVCEGGSITLSVTNPQPGETYNWFGPSGALGSGNTITIDPATTSDAGQYNVSTTAFGCTGPVSVTPLTITVNENPVISIDAPATSFCADNTVTLSAVITNPGGTATIPSSGYQWIQNGNSLVNGTEATLATNQTGTYELTVTNSNNCLTTFSSVILSNFSEPQLDLSTSIIDSADCNSATGSINGVLVANGSANYNFSWYDSGNNLVNTNTSAGTSSLSNAAAGIYQLVVVDNNGCNDTITTTIPSFNPPAAPSVSSNPASCSGQTINPVILSTNGGTIEWYADPALTISLGSGTPFVPNLSVSDTIYAAETLHNCQSSATEVIITINTTPLPPAAASVNYCSGETIQDLTANGGGGVLSWYNDATLNNLIGNGSPFASGITTTDTVYVTETLNSCTSEATIVQVTVNALPAQPLITALNGTNACDGDSITLIASPTTGIIWNPGGSTDSVLVLTGNTSASVTVTDQYGCSTSSAITDVVFFANPSSPVLGTNSAANSFCSGDSILINANPVTGITWNNGSTSAIITTTAAGIYYALYTDANGCTSDTSFIQVTENVLPVAPVLSLSSANNGFCSGSSTTITANPTNGITWLNGSTGSSITVNTGGIYGATVTDNNGCLSDTAFIPATVFSNPVIGAAMNITPATCGNTNGSINGVTVTNGTAPYSYTWLNGTTVSGSDSTLNNVGEGDFVLIVTDINGCSDTSALQNIPSGIGLNIDLSSDVYQGTESLNINLAAATLIGMPVSYTWLLGTTTLGSGTAPVFSVNDLQAGTYTLSVVSASAEGCTAVDSVIIAVDEKTEIIIPNVFTPNGDGINELFTITAKGMKDLKIVIFDRWGIKMYEQEAQTLSWDGKTTAGKDASDGTYYYIFTGKSLNDEAIEKTGYLLLVR